MNLTTFNDVEYEPLRTYNRCVMYFNIWEDSGEEAAKAYIARIPEKGRLQMLETYRQVKKLGAEEVKRKIIREMPLPEEEEISG